MPPKRGRGRGRGAPRTSEQSARPGSQQQEAFEPHVPPSRSISEQEQRPPPGFFAQPPSQPQVTRTPVVTEDDPRKKERPKKKEIAMKPEDLGMEFKYKMALSTPFPQRPTPGTLGRRIKLISNCYPINLPSGFVYHYDVDIVSTKRNPESASKGSDVVPAGADKKDKKYRCLSTKKNREIINLMLDTDRHFNSLLAAYDGQKNLYTRKPIEAHFPLKCQVVIPDENPGNPKDPRGPKTDEFEVQIKPVKKKDTNSCAISLDSLHALFEGKISEVPQEAVMALETVLRHGPCLKFTPIGRSFFYPPSQDELHPLGGGREIWFGYHQSLRLGQWQPMVNLDITASTFYEKGPLLNYIADLLKTTVDELARIPRINDRDIKQINSELKNLRIETTHLKNYRRKYRIIRLVSESANRLEFPLKSDNGSVRKVTVARYFQEEHKRRLQFPNLPCVQVNPEAKQVYLPIEVCEVIEGQHCKKKLDERQNAEMIKVTARPPDRRFKEINGIVNRAQFNRDKYVREFGIEVSREPLKLEGRILDAPNVRYNNEQKKRPMSGSWTMDQVKFFRGAEINSWVFLSFAQPRFIPMDNLDNFAQKLVRIARDVGISINRPSYIDICDTRCDMKRLLTDMKSKYKADLAVIVVPSRLKTVYGDVKQAAETVVGLTTQCIKEDNVRKGIPAVIGNLCQKINAKMGGINNSLVMDEVPPIMKKPVIIIGADVTHPGPSNEIKPSIAACVGSLDAYPSRYAVSIRAQTNVDERKQSIEIILDLKSMVIELLKAFYRNTRQKKPENIIFYRDGVSEGQFEKVRDHEVKCIREACTSLSPDYQPGITFIVVQKRHHTRFMPQDGRDGVGKMRNVPPGTAVDTAVVHPVNFDFFLCSHFGLQGTSRPSHYTVIEDDNKFSSNDLQKLTFYLCHIYARCTKSISYPAPVQYAHLAAYRARQHLVSQIEESTTSSDTPSEYHALPQTVIDAIKVIDDLKSTMYFV